MNKEPEMKYPHSANLFQFCRRILDHKYGGGRIIDQDVGQILGFDPADCSHWKKGKKNIKSIYAMKSIADQLEVDERLVVDVASGELTELEAYYEFSGYGPFTIDLKLFEEAKKDYYRKNVSKWSKDKDTEFKVSFHPDSSLIDQIVSQIHQRINFAEPPLYLPEVAAFYPEISLQTFAAAANGQDQQAPLTVESSPSRIAIRYVQGFESRPYVRYRIAKTIAPMFLAKREKIEGMDRYLEHLADVESNLFASKLLIPADLVKKELAQMNPKKDIITQLSEAFWVSKSLMNRRLKEILIAC